MFFGSNLLVLVSIFLVLVSKTPVKAGEPFQLLQGLSIAKVGKV
jgi:hypothetical protein